MFLRFRPLPVPAVVSAGPVHLTCRPFRGEYRNQRAIGVLSGELYQDLLERHRIIGFDAAVLYLDLTEEWAGRGMAGFLFQENSAGVIGANRHLQNHFGSRAMPLEDTFQRDWERMVADDQLTTIIIPEQSTTDPEASGTRPHEPEPQ